MPRFIGAFAFGEALMSRRFILFAAMLWAPGSTWAARKPGDPLKPGFNLFSRQDDVKVGQENAKQVLQQSDVVKNQAVQDYVQRLGQKLAAMPEARQSGFDFTFTVLNVDEINAFALPGGPMFIYTDRKSTRLNSSHVSESR